MRELPQADYDFMQAFSEMLIEGGLSLLQSLLGVADTAAADSPELKKQLDKAKAQASKLAKGKTKRSGSSDSGSDAEESINRDEYLAARNNKLLPQIKHVSKKFEADRRFDYYEKKGLLAECLKQREERLKN